MLEIGALDNVRCPVCGCDSHFECVDSSCDVEDDILAIRSKIFCGECESSFKMTQRFSIEFLDCYISCIDERHESEFGEGKFAFEEEPRKTGDCPYDIFFCTDCYKNNTEMCPHWRDSNG